MQQVAKHRKIDAIILKGNTWVLCSCSLRNMLVLNIKLAFMFLSLKEALSSKVAVL